MGACFEFRPSLVMVSVLPQKGLTQCEAAMPSARHRLSRCTWWAGCAVWLVGVVEEEWDMPVIAFQVFATIPANLPRYGTVVQTVLVYRCERSGVGMCGLDARPAGSLCRL
jgi:hypothetical protein